MICATLGVQGNTNLPLRNPNPKISLHRTNLSPILRKCKQFIHVRELHAKVIRTEQDQNPFIVFELIRLCSNLGSVEHGHTIFRRVRSPNVFLYTALLDGFVSSGSFSDAVRLYYAMIAGGEAFPDGYAMTSALRACGFGSDPKSGREIHGHGTKLGLCSNRSVKMKLVELYGKCGEFKEARKVFDEMPERDVVASTVLISCYFDHGMVKEAIEVFDRVREKDTVCWTAMIDGLVKNDETDRAMEVFREMQSRNAKPNESTIVCVLSACSRSGALELGRWVHSYAGKHGLKINPFVGGALISMYSRCGDIETALKVFNEMLVRDVTTYNAIIAGLGSHGKSREAIEMFWSMVELGFRPNDVTFVGVLNACSHNGLVELGLEFFESMVRDYGIEPQIEHYGCVVDLLGRAGKLEEAYAFIERSKARPDNIMLGALLSACKTHGNLELGEKIAKTLLENGEADSGTFVLLSNVYASSGKWKESAITRASMKNRGIEKEPGCSSIEIDNEVHEFLLGDIRHPRRGEIYAKLDEIDQKIRSDGGGYSPETSVSLQDVEDREKERALAMHSERLAISYGLISTEPRSVLRVVKNLRVCNDCHSVIKLISKVYERKIVVRDRNRFHHFENGVCSCGDYW